uniref:Chloride channel protein n=1 Tax=Guillardia theta TaxID=55529 RepID=A0A7S4HA48_GUITH|mmetsp:Transcript_11851/g.40850  ORF Transcript_11851/g.40850 Transcript_11851/m.40850 type:complete len:789 (+) Transcript_11851:92-2458(+)
MSSKQGSRSLLGLPPDQDIPTSHSIFSDDDPLDIPSRAAQSPEGEEASQPSRKGLGRGIASESFDIASGLHVEDAKLDSMPEVKDFMTIDWTYYAEKDRERRIQGLRGGRRSAIFRVLLNIYDAMQSWLALTAVGFTCGALAAMVGTGSDWANDIKFGMCYGRGFWITRQMCCKDSADMLSCSNWKSWAQLLGASHASSEQVVSYVIYISIAVLQAGYAAWLCKVFAPYAVASGIGEIKVILSGFVIKKFLGGWTLLIKCVGLVLAVGSGLSIGKEGPFIHVSCCVANVMSRFFSKFATNEVRKRELLSASAAAGIAVAFGAPVGGVLFSFEEVSLYFPPKTMWRALFCATVAAMSLQRLNPQPSGKMVLFEITYHHKWRLFELIPFAFIGVIGGLVGVFISKMNVRVSRFRKTSQLKKWPVTEVCVTALITSLVDYIIVYLRGSSMLLLYALFAECKNSNQDTFEELCNHENGREILFFLILSAIIKTLLTIITFGNPCPGGVFVPALVIGGLIGRAVGFSLQLLENEIGDVGIFSPCRSSTSCITPGVYAIVGAAAVLGGVTRMTVCLVVVMFEVTGGYEYVLPVMVGVLLSKWVADAFGKSSIYIELIHLKGYPHLDNKREYAFNERASDVMSCRELFVLSINGNTVESIEGLLETTSYQGFPVVTSPSEMLVVGFISRDSLTQVMRKCRNHPRLTGKTKCFFSSKVDCDDPYVDLSPWLDQSPIQIVETTPLDRVIEMFRALGLRYLLVTHNGQLVGILKKKDILEHIELYRKGLSDRREANDL